MSLQGAPQLRSRLSAIQKMPKSYGKGWAERCVKEAQRRVPVRTGTLQRSIRVGTVSGTSARVVANYTAFFIDHGTKAHDEVPKKSRRATKKRAARTAKRALVFEVGGRTVFARKVHKVAHPGNQFRSQAAHAALAGNPLAKALTILWDKAA